MPLATNSYPSKVKPLFMGQIFHIYNPSRKSNQQDEQLKIQQDPLYFFSEYLGEKPPNRYGFYPKQIEIIESVRDNRRTACVGCNSSGKDFTAGRIPLWWLSAYNQAKVVIVAPSYTQIHSIIWKETRLAYQSALYPLGGKILETPYWSLADDRFVIGLSTDNPMNLQGFHSPNLMVIISEAHAMEQSHIEALKRLNPKRILLTGNPFCISGEFYDAFHINAELYHGISISAYDTPNIIECKEIIPGMITLQDIEERKKEWGENSPLFLASVMGQFSESLQNTLISRAAVDNAIKRQTTEDERFKAVPILACDVAWDGEDFTVATLREGPRARIVWRVNGKSPMEICGWLKGFLEDYNLAADKWNEEHEKSEIKRQKLQRVVIDAVGLGAGVVSRLREQDIAVVAFKGGEKPSSDKWQDKNAEAWGTMAEAFRDGKIQIDNDLKLIGELCSRQSEIQSDRCIKLISKKEMKSKGLKSPDSGDSLAMTFTPAANAGFKIWV